MRKNIRTAIAAAAVTCMTANAWAAAANCARQQDIDAMKTAAVQQKLMVAALSCNAVARYNQFVTSFQRELQASDRALQNFFRRLNPRNGTADYHAFKTRQANAASMTSIQHITNFCNDAQNIFNTALDSGQQTFPAFLVTQPYVTDARYDECPLQVAGGIAFDAEPPGAAPLPRSKPGPMPAGDFSLRPPLGSGQGVY